MIGEDTLQRINHVCVCVCVSAQNAVILSGSLLPITSAQQNTDLFHLIYTFTPEIDALVANESGWLYELVGCAWK